MSLPLPLASGTVIDNTYVIVSLLNSGGLGAVYRATDKSEGNRLCAIKETYDVTPTARRQALIEAAILLTVKSDHLPQVYDTFEANGRFYLVMQLIEGQDLLHLLRDRVASRHMAIVGEQEPRQALTGPCSESEVLAWMLPIMAIVQELHGRNPAVVHRDIKPANIILTPDHRAVLVDFGVTKLHDAQAITTQTLVRAVSQGFSPLEQYTGRTGPQADIYALAATMYLLLTNRLPPPAITRSTQDKLVAPRLLNPSISPRVEQALLKALAVQTSQRYRTMREFADALSTSPAPAATDVSMSGGMNNAQTMPHQTAYAPPPPLPVYPVLPAPPALSRQHTVSPQPARPLPTPFGQGCLFGLVQAVLAAVLILFLKKTPSFYLATCIGFAFYALAGFMTTRRGGSALRGGWSGVWAGITSAIMFWVILFLGLVVLLAHQIEVASTAATNQGKQVSPDELRIAWSAVQPDYPVGSLALTHTPWLNLLLLLGGSVLLASIIGWVGGILGRSRHQKKIAKKQQHLLQTQAL